MLGNRVVEIEQTTFLELHDRHRGRHLGHRPPLVDRVTSGAHATGAVGKTISRLMDDGPVLHYHDRQARGRAGRGQLLQVSGKLLQVGDLRRRLARVRGQDEQHQHHHAKHQNDSDYDFRGGDQDRFGSTALLLLDVVVVGFVRFIGGANLRDGSGHLLRYWGNGLVRISWTRWQSSAGPTPAQGKRRLADRGKCDRGCEIDEDESHQVNEPRAQPADLPQRLPSPDYVA